MHLLVVNGPNLNLLGSREPDVYGSESLADLEARIAGWAGSAGADVECRQSNDEAEIIGWIQGFDGDGMIINPGAFTHTSHAIADAIRSLDAPVVEVHISNIKEREPWRSVSLLSDACECTIFGRGFGGYRDAIRHLVNRSAMSFETVAYGPNPQQVGDLRRGGASLAIFVHGGLWKEVYARDSMEALAIDLARRGFDTWNLEYRRLGNGGGWPASGQDLLMALDFVPQLDSDAVRVVIVSHSAGSHLAMWAAQRSNTAIDLHVALGPLIDLEAAIDHDDTGAEQARRLTEDGATGQKPGRVETVLVHGTADQIVPLSRSVKIAEETGTELHQPDCDHFELLEPTRREWKWIVDRIGGPV